MTTESNQIQHLLSRYPIEKRFLIHSGHGLYEPLADCVSEDHTLLVQADEKHKSIGTVESIWQFLLHVGADRQSLLIVVGGGVLTDLGGFAAATYMRGINWLSIPTTLLSMVDAGLGGKTGFNFGQIKNSIGAFHQPEEVYIDTRYLDTLPGEQILSGYGEMVKHHLISGQPLCAPDLISRDDIVRSIAVKEQIVAQDPHEQGIRKALNFGHTIGHALEALSLQGDRPLLHGYAVMYGMVAELYLSHVLLGLEKEVVSYAAHLVTEYYGRPNVSCRRYPDLIELMRHDKKGALRFTLLRHLGEPVIDQTISEALILEALDYLFTI